MGLCCLPGIAQRYCRYRIETPEFPVRQFNGGDTGHGPVVRGTTLPGHQHALQEREERLELFIAPFTRPKPS